MPSNAAVAQKIIEKQQAYWEYISKKDRDAIPADDFAGPNRSFPIRNQQDVMDAARLIGHADNPEQVKANIIRIAKRKGLDIPDAWKEKPKESSMVSVPIVQPSMTAIQPIGEPLATIKVCWLEDDAVSLNKRQYPREAVDRLLQSAQVRLSDPNALPMPCYLSHDDADKDVTGHLVGRIARVWREGTKAMAAIAIAATDAGRNLLSLVEGNFIKSMSLRADGGELTMSRDEAYPQVRGQGLRLLGIDFTTRPGLAEVARIEGFLAESQEAQQDIFEASDLAVEEAGPPRYTDLSINIEAMSSIHDHLAAVLDRAIAPIHSRESTEQDPLEEAGRKIAKGPMQRLVAAHDEAAKACAMECYEAYHSHLAMDNNMEQKENLPMPEETPPQGGNVVEQKKTTAEEALRILQEAGYQIKPPKTQEEIIEEKVAALVATRIDEALARMQPAQAAPVQQTPPQRTSLVEGATPEPQKRTYYRPGDYIREQMRNLDPHELMDRSRPLPSWLDPERALKEYGTVLLGLYDQRFGLEG